MVRKHGFEEVAGTYSVHEDLEVAAQRSDVLATSAWMAQQDPESVTSEAEAREQRTLSCHVFVSTE